MAKEGVYDVKKQLSVIVRSLERWGIRAVVSGRNDILAEGRKFSGNAFLRENGFGLHHGTVLINTDIEVMTRVLNVDKVKLDSKGVKSVSARVLNLSELNGNIEKRALIEEIRSAAEEIYGVPAQEIKAAFNAENARMKAMLSSKEWLLNRVRDQSDGYIVRRARFDWGGVELIYKQEAGRVKELFIFSDAMDAEEIVRINKRLEGAFIADFKPDGAMSRDIIRLFEETEK